MLSIEPNSSKLIQVAIAVIQRKDGAILLSKRKKESLQGGLWEFPGGKLEPDENAVDALKRELYEELDIQIIEHKKLIVIEHDYVDYRVKISVYLVNEWLGDAHGKESQVIEWVNPDDLKDKRMPTANSAILNAIKLPDRYFITPAEVENTQVFMQVIEDNLKSGIRLVQYRVFGLSKKDNEVLAGQVKACCIRYSAQLLINHDVELMEQIKADGLHLNSQQLLSFDKRPISKALLLSASCHNKEQLIKAGEYCDFAALSPVLPTQSHPDADLLGWDKFEKLVGKVNIPVYALGGMNKECIEIAQKLGGQGIAGIRALQ